MLADLPSKAGVVSTLDSTQQSALSNHLTEDEVRALAFLDEDHRALIAAANAEILRREFRSRTVLLRQRGDGAPHGPAVGRCGRVRQPSARDRRSWLWQTSVMVARAAYAIARGFVPGDRILMLAFNADAAKELQERVTRRLSALGLPSEGVYASTFHAFGLSLIGQATGRKPRLAPWVENGAGLGQGRADRRRSAGFHPRLPIQVGRLPPAVQPHLRGSEGGEPDSYDRTTRLTGFQTYRGQTVRNHGERLIADLFYLYGVNYHYERPLPPRRR